MKKIICTITLLFILSNSALATKEASIDTTAKNIAAKTSNLKPKVIKLAIEAFYRAKRAGVTVKKPILTIIDYTLASTQKRLWVVDLGSNRVLYTSMCAHGKHSGENYTTSFSNRMGSLQTSIGLFLTKDTYFGNDGYSLRLEGLEKGFNDNAKDRLIVFHGAPYVNQKFAAVAGRIGRSWGCPAVEKPLAEPIINTIKNGTLIFSFYNHPQWLSESMFINNKA
ncbi:MAG: murein L,D-transpeptidase catalytic domain family protein [bacterium]